VTGRLVIRAVTPTDRPMWTPLWDGYNAFYGRQGSTALDPVITETTWGRFFDSYEPVYGLVAERDGKLVGLVNYLLHRSTTAIAPAVYLQDLFTHPEARGAGVGRHLIEAVYARAAELGAGRVYWHTHESNSAAMLLYDALAEKSGFVVYRHMLP
jgi:GNAT superfamily N-acetyltransferase